ncbi:MAG: hypothetical protein ACREMT_03110, partial [Vulcanimicrobiaceae bacterium]
MASAPAVDVLLQVRGGRIEQPLTYAVPAGTDPRIGDVVRVPLRNREAYGYVVSAPFAGNGIAVRSIASFPRAPRAFDETGLALARFIAYRYVCTLGEALATVVLAAAVPRVEDRLHIAAPEPQADRYPGIPSRLLRLLWEDFREDFALEALLRHP